jgi:hypothetical protein
MTRAKRGSHRSNAYGAFMGEIQMRLYRLSFIAGFAAGFVAGTRAGRERYDQMVKLAKTAAENPTVQQAAGAIQAQASTLASTTAQKVGGQLHEKVPHMAQQAAHTVGERIPGLRHRSASRTHGNGSGDGHPFTPSADGHIGPGDN